MSYGERGTPWKNSEDEVLKAAVMKYGLNQWSRISSLLVHRTAKQCKARWYEWLDPKINRGAWTTQEEEKLLHLAKIMPCQWRTIAPMVGRTASQCLEHYAALLDRAQGGKEETKAPEDTLDPNMEVRPAVPDAVDMDQDELEMLNEARARLANTKGKKAKRKAREKQLNEARRLAMLQRDRELKAAGIENVVAPKRKTKKPVIDYSAEIPLERRAPRGLFDTTEEDRDAKRQRLTAESFKPTSIEELEGKRRDEVEAMERKKDERRQAIMKKDNMPQYLEQLNRAAGKAASQTRSRISMPEPQRSARDLAALQKSAGDYDAERSTSRLYAAATSREKHETDRIHQQARHLASLMQLQTPLAGGSSSTLEYLPPSVEAKPAEAAPVSTVSSILQGLSSLPKPKEAKRKPVRRTEVASGPVKKQHIEPDAEAVEKAQEEEQRRQDEHAFQMRSLVYQRGLPVPSAVPCGLVPYNQGLSGSNALHQRFHEEAMRLLCQDLELYRRNDRAFQSSIAKLKEQLSTDEGDYSITELAVARNMVKEEAGDPDTTSFTPMPPVSYTQCVHPIFKSYSSTWKRNDRLERSIALKQAGYRSRSQAARTQYQETLLRLQTLDTDAACYQHLMELEQTGITHRHDRLTAYLGSLVALEAELQKEYSAVMN